MKHFATALVLLVLALVVTEVVLQLTDAPPARYVTSRATEQFQPMLVPSATMYHEMLRLTEHQTPGGMTFRTNSLGLRAVEPARQKSADQVRVIVLGDQSVLGPELPEEHTVPGRLRIFLTQATGRDVDVINAGIPGYSPLLSWLQFRHELQRLSPDVVVLHFDMTDVADDSLYRGHLKESGDHQICVNPLLGDAQIANSPVGRAFQNSALLRRLRSFAGVSAEAQAQAASIRGQYEWTTGTPSDLRLQIQHALGPIERFGSTADRERFHFLVSTSPVPWQVTSSDGFSALAAQPGAPTNWPVTDDVPHQILRAACERNAVHFCDATSAFRSFSQPDKLFAPDSAELSAYGSTLYAREIASKLLSTPDFAGLFTQTETTSARPRHLN